MTCREAFWVKPCRCCRDYAVFSPADDWTLMWGDQLWDVRAPRALHRFDSFTSFATGYFHPAGDCQCTPTRPCLAGSAWSCAPQMFISKCKSFICQALVTTPCAYGLHTKHPEPRYCTIR